MTATLTAVILTVTISTVVLVAGCAQVSREESRIAFSTYQNETYGYSIEYPSSWTVEGSGESVHMSGEPENGIDVRVDKAPQVARVIADEYAGQADIVSTYPGAYWAVRGEWFIDDFIQRLSEDMPHFLLCYKTWLDPVMMHSSWDSSGPYPLSAWEIVFITKDADTSRLTKLREFVVGDYVYTITAMSAQWDGGWGEGDWLEQYSYMGMDSSGSGTEQLMTLPPRTECMVDYVLHSFKLSG